MIRRDPIKDNLFEAYLFRNRAMFAAFVVFVLVLVLLVRLYYLQSVSYKHYSTLSTNNRVRLVAVPPPRGLIFDRNGQVLAQNQPSYRLEITPEQVKDVDATLSALAELISLEEADVQRFRRVLARSRPFDGIPLRFNLSDVEVARFAVDRHLFPGVEIVAAASRSYPYGELLSHVLGYVGRIDEDELRELDEANYRGTSHVGKIGIEKFYESELHGTVGYRQVEVNVQGRVLRVLEETPPLPGRDLHLSIDVNLQAAAQAALGDYTGAVVALDPNNGEVLSLLSQPGYDPNLFVHGIAVEAYRKLNQDTNKPLFNRALTGRYPPGSTIKPFIGLGALELDVESPGHRIYCGGYFMLPNDDRRYRDWKRTGHGWVDLTQAVAQSCDVYFYDLAVRMGIDRISPYLAEFGFGALTGIDTTGESSALLPSREWKRASRGQPWYPGETLIAGIGQGYLNTTPLQLAHATATLAAGGLRLRPRLLLRANPPIVGTDAFDSVDLLTPVAVVDQGHWDHIIGSMVEVTRGARGTARGSLADSVPAVAGKTGTAQVFGLGQEEEYDAEEIEFKLRDHALFVAFAPADNPQIAIAVVVEHGGSGGAVAAPIARDVLDRFFTPD